MEASFCGDENEKKCQDDVFQDPYEREVECICD